MVVPLGKSFGRSLGNHVMVFTGWGRADISFATMSIAEINKKNTLFILKKE